MKMFHRKDEGFTLVELMVVVLIIGILIAIAVPVFNAARAKAEERTCHSNQRILEGAFQTYYASNETTPGSGSAPATNDAMNDLTSGNYVTEEPFCPDENSTASATGGGYTFTLAGIVDDCTGSDSDHNHY